jgi:hypothetical protein
MAPADQADADEADAHAVVGARHAPRRGGSRQRGSPRGPFRNARR